MRMQPAAPLSGARAKVPSRKTPSPALVSPPHLRAPLLGASPSLPPRCQVARPSSACAPRASRIVRQLSSHPLRAPRTRCSEPSEGSSHQPGPATPSPPGAAEAVAGGPSVPPILLSPLVAGQSPSPGSSSCLLGPVPSLLGLFTGGNVSGPLSTESSSEPPRGATAPREGPSAASSRSAEASRAFPSICS
jgi:hypothetical protein